MTDMDVRKLVENQIGDQWDRTNLHGIRLQKCLINPKLMTFIDLNNKSIEAWLVLLENPQSILGYGIVYEETSNEFGLAQFAEKHDPCLLGLYGDFFRTLEAM